MVLSLLLRRPDGGGAGVEPMNVMHTNLSGGGKNDYECALAEHVKGTKSLFRNLLRIEF